MEDDVDEEVEDDVETELLDEEDELSSRSPAIPNTAKSTVMLGLMPSCWMRKREDAAPTA